ncbi:hypothetical protein [Sphingopyxis sp. JAI128]|uniref:hypothetical protein n=1 Tax=Sphingopyxis sp. JAI128 TaxID=2723066 RepID=UPI0016207F8C|nr:hypothetical protein [Sphingopyxis sp. JAI128]MBB6425235.1 NADPH-dependent 2,4-dienoyl-CoA reductase/sulfur reductase-like enzyme [Sphingopyxis sp. JAI128]
MGKGATPGGSSRNTRAEFRLGETKATARPQDMVLVGAGIVGMATAPTLSDRGHRVTGID